KDPARRTKDALTILSCHAVTHDNNTRNICRNATVSKSFLLSPGADGRMRHMGTEKGKLVMDMSRYSGLSFLSLDDVQDGPITGEIAAIEEGDYGRPVI